MKMRRSCRLCVTALLACTLVDVCSCVRHFAGQGLQGTDFSTSQQETASNLSTFLPTSLLAEMLSFRSTSDAAPPVPASTLAKFAKQPTYGAPEGLAPPTVTIAPQFSAKPRIMFLFMVYGKLQNEDIWNTFFDAAVQGIDYRAIVHCKSEQDCRQNIKSQHRFEIISSVATTYCFNLVDGMNALLRAVLVHGGAGHPNDKFVFASDSTLPVKPFPYMLHRLTVEAGPVSDFCIFPRSEWAEVTETGSLPIFPPITRAAVKHHQWIILSREHAEMSIAHAHEMKDLMTTFQLNMGYRNTGCLDEFWHFAILFKALNMTAHPSSVNMQGFSASPLQTTSMELQGRCNTFVHWLPRASGTNNNITQLAAMLRSDPGTELTPVSEKRPASIKRLSKTALMNLRNSDFLFARKIGDDCTFSGCDTLQEAFSSLIFSTPPRPLAKAAPTWSGQGMWTDNRQLPATITSLDGALRLSGSDSSMDATGSYCGMNANIAFSNGFRSVAQLSPDNQQLTWENGVVWFRA